MSNENFIPLPVQQMIMKNKLETQKVQALLEAKVLENQIQVSELKNVKWFWEKTIATLLHNWITTLTQFEALEEQEAYKFLTPVQFHQIHLYIKNNQK